MNPSRTGSGPQSPAKLRPNRAKAGLHPLEGWMVLQVAELLEYEDIQTLRSTTKTLRGTLDAYEHSTAIHNIARRVFPVPPRETILCSAFPERPVIRLASYAAIKELEARRRKIKYLIEDSMYLRYGYLRCGLARTDPELRAMATRALERAMWICTDLADLEAEGRKPSPYFNPWPKKLECVHQPADFTEEELADSCYETDAAVLQTVMLHGHRTPNIHLDGTVQAMAQKIAAKARAGKASLPSNAVRQAQLDVIKDLDTTDLCAMFVLSTLAITGFEEYLGSKRIGSYPRNIVTEWCVAVAENSYRHGVFFLYPQALRGQPSELSYSATTHEIMSAMEKDGTAQEMAELAPYLGLPVPKIPPRAPKAPKATRSRRSRKNKNSSKNPKRTWTRKKPCCVSCSRRMAGHAAAMVCQVVEEMHRWEEGQDEMLPSLAMTIRSTLRRRFNCEPDDVPYNASRIIKGQPPLRTMEM